MKRTEAPNSVSGLYVDKDPGITVGTKLIAEDRNLIQEEICNAIEGSGETLSGADDEQLKKAIISLSKSIGEPFFNIFEKSPSVIFPAVRIDDADHDIDVANWPDLVPLLRAHKLRAGSTTDFTCTVAGSVITFDDDTDENILLAALAEELLAHVQGGGVAYTGWLSINVGGTDFVISDVDAGAHTVTVTGSPSTGSQTVIVYSYRIAGSGTTARLRRVNAKSVVSHDGEECLAGLRRRDRMQQITGSIEADRIWTTVTEETGALSAGTSASSEHPGTSNNATNHRLNFDSANSPDARTGTTTDPRAFVGYLYLHGGRYVA